MNQSNEVSKGKTWMLEERYLNRSITSLINLHTQISIEYSTK